ncbi:hypothetical protein D3C80_1809990 [compost metagenome]
MFAAVAVNLYQTSWEIEGAQEGVFPFSIAPLKVPEIVLQLLFGVNSIAFAHKSFTGVGYLRIQIPKVKAFNEADVLNTRT